jgi:hypothetical protein
LCSSRIIDWNVQTKEYNTEYIARTRNIRNTYKFLSDFLREKDNFVDLGLVGKIMLKYRMFH